MAQKIDEDFKNHNMIYWKREKDDYNVIHVEGSDCIELMENMLNLLPRPKLIDENEFNVSEHFLFYLQD